MTDRAEAIATALEAALRTIAGPKIRRGGADAEDIDAAGLIHLVDGAPVEGEERLGGSVPREYTVTHDVEIAVAHPDDATRATTLATMAQAVADAVAASAPLAALIDHLRLHPLRDRQTLTMPGAVAVLTATVPVEIDYRTARNPMEDL